LKGLLEKAGFVVKGQYGSYSREAYSVDSGRLIVLAMPNRVKISQETTRQAFYCKQVLSTNYG
jgi:hypothetical protein